MILKLYIKLKEYLYHQAYKKAKLNDIKNPKVIKYLNNQHREIAALKAIIKTK